MIFSKDLNASTIIAYPKEPINTVIVPFELVDGLIIVKASINGEESGNFILDTGAKGLVLNSAYYESTSNAELVSLGLNGVVSNVGNRIVDSFIVDELIFTNIKVDVINIKQIELKKKTSIRGLIGYELIKDFEILFDYQKRYMTLSRLDNTGNIIDVMEQTRDKVDSFDITIVKTIPMIEIYIGKIKKKMVIDSGSETCLLSSQKNEEILSNFEPKKKIKVTGSEGRSKELIAGKLYRMALEGNKYRFGALSCVLMNLDNLDQIYNTKIDGVLGFEFLSTWKLSLNYKKKKLYIHELKYSKP